eukprot:scaffold513_cov71-Phaeocystis_antarctica.AAC.3
MSPSVSNGVGSRTNRASASAWTTLRPAARTCTPKRCRSPMMFSLVIGTPCCARGSSTTGAPMPPRSSKVCSSASMATTVNQRTPALTAVRHQLRTNSAKSWVAKTSATVLPSAEWAAASFMMRSVATGSSIWGAARG